MSFSFAIVFHFLIFPIPFYHSLPFSCLCRVFSSDKQNVCSGHPDLPAAPFVAFCQLAIVIINCLGDFHNLDSGYSDASFIIGILFLYHPDDHLCPVHHGRPAAGACRLYLCLLASLILYFLELFGYQGHSLWRRDRHSQWVWLLSIDILMAPLYLKDLHGLRI